LHAEYAGAHLGALRHFLSAAFSWRPTAPPFLDAIHEYQDQYGAAKNGYGSGELGGFDHALLRRAEAYPNLTKEVELIPVAQVIAGLKSGLLGQVTHVAATLIGLAAAGFTAPDP
jgi:hypothetical protein